MKEKKQLFENQELLQITEDCLKKIKLLGIDQAEVVLNQELGFSVTARENEVETVEHHQAKGIIITVYKDQRTGSASSSDLSSKSIQNAVEKACSIARFSGQDPYSGLAESTHLAYDYPNLELHHHWELTPSEGIQMAIECEQVALEQDKRIIHSEGVSVSTYDSFHVYANSHGFCGYYPTSHHLMSCHLVAEEAGQMQREGEYSSARKPELLEDLSLIAKQAAQKTVSRLGARKIKTQYCPVLFHAPVAKGLLAILVRAISGRSLYTKSTFLLDSLNKIIFPEFVHIYQQPHLLAGMGSAPFDNEGVKTHDIDFVRDGKLLSYVLGSYSARKLGMQTTGNAGGVFNLMITPGELQLTKLFSQMQTGLLVTELMGQGINLMTGDYSRGASGYWIEKGEIQYPVEEITIAGNLKDMFAQILAVGNDIDSRGNIHTGSILIDKMMVAGA